MKRLTLCVLLILSLLMVFMTAAGAEPAAIISSVKITGLRAPIIGEKPDYYPSITAAGARIETEWNLSNWKSGVRWIDKTTSKEVDKETGIFEAGHTYSVVVSVVATGDYQFPASGTIPCYFDDVAGSKLTGPSRTNWTFTRDYDPLPNLTHVDNVALTIAAPKVGENPAYNATASGAGYDILPYEISTYNWKNGVRWSDETTGKALGAKDVFEAGHSYRVMLYTGVKDGYYFSTDSSKINATINGNAVTKKQYQLNYSMYVFEYVFPALQSTKEISNIAITIAAPKVGEKPAYTATITGEGCAIEAYNSTIWKDGICWKDNLTGEFLKEADVFKAGHQYTLRVSVVSNSGYQFPDNTSKVACTVNGNKALATYTNGDPVTNYVFDYSFPALESTKEISDIAITIAAPKVGEKPAYTATITGEGCAIEAYNSTIWKDGICWKDNLTGEFLKETDVFEAGHQYTLRVSVVSNSGYQFPDDTSKVACTVNGNKALATYTDGDPVTNYVFDYSFPALESAKEIASVSFTISAPKLGEAPSYTATVNGTGYALDMYSNSDHGWKNSVRWLDGDDNAKFDTFNAGKEYSVYITFKPQSGYVIKENFSATINGLTAETRAFQEEMNLVYEASLNFGVLSDEGPVGYTGFASYNGNTYYFVNGKIDETAMGLVLDPNNTADWYFCALGCVQSHYSGLAQYGGEWFYLENGKLNTVRAGLVEYDGGRFMIAAGRILREYNGLIQEPNTGKWYFVAAGQVADYTGLVQYDGAWFYVINGELAVTYSGPVQYDGAWFNVVGGQVVF